MSSPLSPASSTRSSGSGAARSGSRSPTSPLPPWAAAARPDPAPAVWPAAGRCLDAALILLFAPPCATCDGPLDHPSASAVCAACWTAVARWTPPWCACCGQPQSPSRAAADVCPRCRRISGALPVRVVGPYEGRLRDVLHAFKYDGRRSLAPALAALLRARAADVLAAADLVVPVPLHRARRRARGFNQAHDLAARLGPPVIAALRRVRATAGPTAPPASGPPRHPPRGVAPAPARPRRRPRAPPAPGGAPQGGVPRGGGV